MTFATYILQPFYPHCPLPYLAPQMLAAGVIGKEYFKRCLISTFSVLLCMVNCINVKAVSYVQNVFTVMKLAALVLIIFTGFILMLKGDREFFPNRFVLLLFATF